MGDHWTECNVCTVLDGDIPCRGWVEAVRCDHRSAVDRDGCGGAPERPARCWTRRLKWRAKPFGLALACGKRPGSRPLRPRAVHALPKDQGNAAKQRGRGDQQPHR
jgi:hypothetical protein